MTATAKSIESQFLSIADAAILFGVSRWTVARLIDDGELPAIRVRGIPRIDRDDLAAWIAAQKAASLQQSQEKKAAEAPRRGRGRPRKAAINTQKTATAAASV